MSQGSFQLFEQSHADDPSLGGRPSTDPTTTAYIRVTTKYADSDPIAMAALKQMRRFQQRATAQFTPFLLSLDQLLPTTATNADIRSAIAESARQLTLKRRANDAREPVLVCSLPYLKVQTMRTVKSVG